MLVVSLLYILFGFNLARVIMEKTNTFYKDIRFWIVFISLFILGFLTLKSYPMS